jgi:hypothetical protein
MYDSEIAFIEEVNKWHIDMHGVSFIVSLSTASSLHREPASAGISLDSCHALGWQNGHLYYIFILNPYMASWYSG